MTRRDPDVTERVVYIVTSGSYSDYGINAVFDTHEAAQHWIDNPKWVIHEPGSHLLLPVRWRANAIPGGYWIYADTREDLDTRIAVATEAKAWLRDWRPNIEEWPLHSIGEGPT